MAGRPGFSVLNSDGVPDDAPVVRERKLRAALPAVFLAHLANILPVTAPTTLTKALRLAAYSLQRNKSALGAFFRRLKGRLGAGKAVTAVDGSGVALDVLERRARELHNGVNRIRDRNHVVGSSREIQLVQADLEHATLPVSSFSLILCVHYLQRSLFAAMQAALLPGGMLLFETYTRAQVEGAGGPKNPAYLLEIGELRTAFPALRIVFYRELRAGKGIASLIAQKAG